MEHCGAENLCLIGLFVPQYSLVDNLRWSVILSGVQDFCLLDFPSWIVTWGFCPLWIGISNPKVLNVLCSSRRYFPGYITLWLLNLMVRRVSGWSLAESLGRWPLPPYIPAVSSCKRIQVHVDGLWEIVLWCLFSGARQMSSWNGELIYLLLALNVYDGHLRRNDWHKWGFVLRGSDVVH